MTKVVRLTDETIRLLNIYRNWLKEEFEKNQLFYMDDVLKNDNLIIQTALRTAIELESGYLLGSE